MHVITKATNQPRNKDHFAKLLDFCEDVLTVCENLGITPILSGSLAVFIYTQCDALSVNDIDLACCERKFPKLRPALEANGIPTVLKDWKVLQARKDGLKVEFDSIEHWMVGLTDDCDNLMLCGKLVRIVSLSSLKELYRRGLEATGDSSDPTHVVKHQDIAANYDILMRY